MEFSKWQHLSATIISPSLHIELLYNVKSLENILLSKNKISVAARSLRKNGEVFINQNALENKMFWNRFFVVLKISVVFFPVLSIQEKSTLKLKPQNI